MQGETRAIKRTVPVRENLDAAGLWAFESRHGESFAMDFTAHRFLKLLLITQGSGEVEGDWGRPLCKMGDLVVVPIGLRHRIIDHPRQPISLYGVGIAPKLLRCVPRLSEALPGGVLRADQLGPLRLERRMRRLLYAHGQPGAAYQLAAVAAALDLVAQASLAMLKAPVVAAAQAPAARAVEARAPAAGAVEDRAVEDPIGESLLDAGVSEGASLAADTDPLLESYLAWLRHNFFEPQSLDEAAAACGLSRRGFTAAFRQRTGSSWLEYRNRLRAEHAIHLLRHTDRKMASIAFQSGFDDLSTFYRVVQRVTGQRPGQFRAGAAAVTAAPAVADASD